MIVTNWGPTHTVQDTGFDSWLGCAKYKIVGEGLEKCSEARNSPAVLIIVMRSLLPTGCASYKDAPAQVELARKHFMYVVTSVGSLHPEYIIHACTS